MGKFIQKSVLAVHDISCVGRCSLTVALPVLSAAGLCVPVLPTAILSTHTGGFPGFTFRDLTEDLVPVTSHWKSLEIGFDAVYTGYLGSKAQIRFAGELLQAYGEQGTIRFVDPVMADHGKLYTGFDRESVNGIRDLCQQADYIFPNMTEALFLLGEEVSEEKPVEEEQLKRILIRLTERGPGSVLLTGVALDEHSLGVAWYSRETQEFGYRMKDRIPGDFYGTGDLFASVLIGGLMNEISLSQSAEIAAEVTHSAILRTVSADADRRYGVVFEPELGRMIQLFEKTKKC